MGEPDPRRLPQRSAHARGPGAPGAGHRRSAIRDRRSGRHGRGRRGSGRPGKDRGPGDPARCVPAARFGAAVHRCRRGGRANARGSRLAGRGRGRRVVGDACPHRRRAAAADPGPRRAGRYGSRRGRSNGARPGQPVHALGGAQRAGHPVAGVRRRRRCSRQVSGGDSTVGRGRDDVDVGVRPAWPGDDRRPTRSGRPRRAAVRGWVDDQ
jgi:hypothetical protein